MKRNEFWLLLLAQLMVYGLVRAVLFHVIPGSGGFIGGRFPINMHLIFHETKRLALHTFSLFLWFALAMAGLPYISKTLMKCLALLPVLAIMTLFVGQFNEARQFNAFIPVAVTFLLC